MLAEAISALEPDVLIVAGDLTADDDLLERTLARLRGSAKEAVFVPGNHDVWCRDDGPSSRERYERIVPSRAESAGFHSLGSMEAPPLLFDHRFVGVTGWYDYSLRNRALDDQFTPAHYSTGRFGPMQWSDKLRVRWPSDEGGLLDDVQICDSQVASLKSQLAAVGDSPTVVVTHHLPFAEMVTQRGNVPWDFLNGFMGALRLGDAIRATPGVRLAVAGHTHFRRDVVIHEGAREIRALTSPLGYPREYKREGYTLHERVRSRVTLVDL